MSNIIVLGGGYGQTNILRVLHERFGSFTLIDINPSAPCREWASRFYNVSIYDFNKCRDAIAGNITEDSAIVTFATGLAGSVCNNLCDYFSLPSRSGSLMLSAINKSKLSEQLRSHGLNVPQGLNITEACCESDLAEISFPALLKPISEGGGRNVRIVRNSREAFEYSKNYKSPSGMMLQERLLGRERVIFLLVQNKQIKALLHGVNIFDKSTGWEGPIGLALERLSIYADIPSWLESIANGLIDAFDLHNDFVVAELISSDSGDYIIDVEINALTPFVCSAVMDNNELTNMLIDIYLNDDSATSCDQNWVSAMTFFVSSNRSKLEKLSDKLIIDTKYCFEPSYDITDLNSFDTTVYKGGYVVVKDAKDLEDASERSLGAVRKIWQDI